MNSPTPILQAMFFPRYLAIFILFLAPAISAQQKAELGITAGTAVYLGDANPDNPISGLTPTFGLIHVYNFNKRFALRNQFSYVSFSGTKPITSVSTGNTGFATSLLDFSSRIEINFRSFKLVDRKHPLSPYINGGLGAAFLLKSSDGSKFQLTFPFGLGIKYGINRRTCIGLEYGIRKSFTDYLDNIHNDIYSLSQTSSGKIKSHPFINNDWYHVTGLYITYRIFDNPGNCPVYNQP